MLFLSVIIGAAGASADLDTVGVLQFANISQSQEYSGLGDGIAENLVNDLKSANFIVVDRLSLKEIIKEIEFSLSDLADEKNAPQIGNLSGATYLITGSYQIMGKNIRLISKVVQTETSIVKCSAKITGAIDSFFDLQDSLSIDIVEKLKGIISVERSTLIEYDIDQEIKKKPTRSIAAYEAYLKGLEYNFLAANKDNPESPGYYDQSIQYLHKAIELDPGMTEALYVLAVDYNNKDNKQEFHNYLKQAMDSIDEDTNMITRLWIYAQNEMHVLKNFKKAAELYKSVLQINSSEIISLWQLFGMYRGAWGSDIYNLEQSNLYGNKLMAYHPKSTMAGYVKEFIKCDRLY